MSDLIESDDSDIFVEYQKKPVNKLTRKDGIQIKNQFLRQSVVPHDVKFIPNPATEVSVKTKTITPSRKNKNANANKAKRATKGTTSAKTTATNARRDKSRTNSRALNTSEKVVASYHPKIEIGKSQVQIQAQTPLKTVEIRASTKLADEVTILQCVSNSNITPLKSSQSQTPKKLMTDYFQMSPKTPSLGSEPKTPPAPSPVKSKKRKSDSRLASPTRDQTTLDTENITLSPGIKRRKSRFKSVTNLTDTSPSKQKNTSPSKSPSRALFKSPGGKRKRKSFGQSTPNVDYVSPLTPSSSQSLSNNVSSLINTESTVKSCVVEGEKSLVAASSSSVKSNQNDSNVTTPASAKRNLFFVPSFTAGNESLMTQIPPDQYPEESSLDAQILTTMIGDVMHKQLYLKEKLYSEEGKIYSLLSETDVKVMEKYITMSGQCQTLYMRMFFRRKGWHRVSTIKYEDLTSNLEEEILELREKGFIETDIEKDEIRAQLNLLKAPEVLQLCKGFSVNVMGGGRVLGRKEELIEALLVDSRLQKSVMDCFNSRQTSSRVVLVGNEARRRLGCCFRLEEKHLNVMSRVVLLFSLVHDIEDESKRASSQRLLIHQVLAGSLRFVPYIAHPTVIFQDRQDLLEYERAINLKQEFENGLQAKLYSVFADTASQARVHFKRLVGNSMYCNRVLELPSFLRRYSGGSVYASILTQYCEFFKKKTDSQLVTDVLSELLDQKIFSVGSRGKWYELLCQAYHSSHLLEDAVQVIMTASMDEFVDEVRTLSLQIKGKTLLKLKKNGLKDEVLREALDDFSTYSVQEPGSIEINAKAMSGNVQGSKIVYIQDTLAGKRYSSVEEQAIYHYKTNGFNQGIHDEGFVISTVYFLFFFDIIYSPKVPGVFQSSYQYRPLDMYSSSFYTSRKDEIDARFKEIEGWTPSDIADKIEAIFAEYMDYACVISWKEYFSPKLLCEIVECIGLTGMVKICQRFIHQPRLARSGFPDLTLWNTVTKKCRFVEVKSPNDRLSSKQRVWMDYLKKNGVDCEVCNVKNTAAKKTR